MGTAIDIAQLKKLLVENKIRQVFDELNSYASSQSDDTFQNKITLLETRWKKLKSDKVKGILSSENQILETNKIHDDLLTLINEIGNSDSSAAIKPDKPKGGAKKSTKKLSLKTIFTALAATVAVLAGIAEISGYSVRDWFERTPVENPKEVPPKDTIVTTPPAPPPEKDTIQKEELPPPKAKLDIQIKTQKGDQDLVFKQSEEVQIYFKVNRPCKLRSIYKLADGMLILLDNDRLVNNPEINKWVQLSDGFEVDEPFGVEELYIFAQEKDFPALRTDQVNGYTIIKEGLPIALSKTRGLKKKIVFAEDKINITTQPKKSN